MQSLLERYFRNTAHDNECTVTKTGNYVASALTETTGDAFAAPPVPLIHHDTEASVPVIPSSSYWIDAGLNVVAAPASPMTTGNARIDEQGETALTALSCEVSSLTPDMSAQQLAMIADPAVRAAGLLIADLLALRDGDAASLTALAVGVEIHEAGRYGEMAVTLYREVLVIRGGAKRKAFEKKRLRRIGSISGFGLDALFDEVARMRGLRA